MSRRTIVRNLVAVMTALMLWQSSFVQPAPAFADDPGSGTLEYCGFGLSCDPNAIDLGSGPIVITGPEDRIVQGFSKSPYNSAEVPPDQAWAFLETEGKAVVAAEHNVPVDDRLMDWARDDIRAYIFTRLLAIAAKPAADRTAQEQTALDTFQDVVQLDQITAAQKAQAEYARWAADPCDYTWPTGTDPNSYRDSLAVLSACTLETDPNYGNPEPPAVEEFTAAGAALAYPLINNDPSASRVTSQTMAGFAELGALGGAGVVAAISAVAAYNIPALAAAVTEAVGSAATEVAAEGGTYVVAYSTEAFIEAGEALYEGAAAVTGAMDLAGPIAIVIFGAVTIAIAIYQEIQDLAIPDKLAASLTSALSQTPDIASMSQDDQGQAQLFGDFIEETLPDYPQTRAGQTPAAHGAGDPTFHIVEHLSLLGNNIDVPSDSDSVTPQTTDSVSPVPQTAYMAGGWWVNTIDTGDPTYTLWVPYVAPDGELWRAGVTQAMVDATTHVPAHPEPTLILVHDGHPDDTTLSRTFTYKVFDATGHTTATATLIPAPENFPPRMSPTAQGDYHEPGQVTFHANVVDPNDDPTTQTDEDPVSIDWWVEPAHAPTIINDIGPDGKSRYDHCYTNPTPPQESSPSQNLTCPWTHLGGANPTYRYGDDGYFHVHVIATDSQGAHVSDIFVVHIANVAPSLTVDQGSAVLLGANGEIDVSGSFSDPGDDQMKVDVDWGDGNTDTQFFPCGYQGACGIFLSPLPGADDPTTWDFKHTYADGAPGAASDFTVTVKATDDDGGVTTKTLTADVRPKLTLACGLTEADLGGNVLHCDQRFGSPGDAIPLRGLLDDPGVQAFDLNVDWGDGTTETFHYPCANGDPCPFQTDSNMFLYQAQANRTFFGLNHTYADAGSYTITATVDDGDGGSDTHTAPAAISGPATVDNPPTALITTPADGATYTLNQVLAADYSCADDNNVASCLGTVAKLANIDTSSVGQHSFTVDATDDANQTGSTTVHYTVVYPFALSAPFVAAPAHNEWTAGTKLRVWFSLGANDGLHVVRGLSLHRQVDCDTGAALGTWVHAHVSRLGYSASHAAYYVVWRTLAKFAGTCRELDIRLADGTDQHLLFHFN